MSQPPWDPYGQQDSSQYQGQPPYQGRPYQGQPYQGHPTYHGQPAYQGQPYPGQPPYQGQPYQGQPYGPPPGQPYPGRGYGNGQGPRPPQRKKRHRVLRVITGVAVAVIGIIVVASIASAGKGSHSVTTGQATPTSSAPKATSPAGLCHHGQALISQVSHLRPWLLSVPSPLRATLARCRRLAPTARDCPPAQNPTDTS